MTVYWSNPNPKLINHGKYLYLNPNLDVDSCRFCVAMGNRKVPELYNHNKTSVTNRTLSLSVNRRRVRTTSSKVTVTEPRQPETIYLPHPDIDFDFEFNNNDDTDDYRPSNPVNAANLGIKEKAKAKRYDNSVSFSFLPYVRCHLYQLKPTPSIIGRTLENMGSVSEFWSG